MACQDSDGTPRGALLLPRASLTNATMRQLPVLAQVVSLGGVARLKQPLGNAALFLDTGRDFVVDAVKQPRHGGEVGRLDGGDVVE